VDSWTPFSQEKLNEIFKTQTKNPDRVHSRECSWLEFKESFGWNSLPRYMKTCVAYANTKGGYIVFGIGNNPHKLRGLKEKNLQAFENLDPEKISNYFNEHFAPEVHWDVQQYELGGNVYGLLYTHEADDKPVVCRKDAGKDLKEGDIYYRYRGRTERIKYPELRAILESKRETEQRLWMQHLAKIARIGVRETGIFDLKSGLVTGTGGTFLIDESLLSQLSFIKEGEFSEVKGKPALKLIGSVKPIGSIPLGGSRRQIVKIKGIRVGDIVLDFLNQVTVPEPQEYITQICFENTAFLPVYYYINAAGLDQGSTIGMLNAVVARSASKAKLIERISNGSTQRLALPSGSSLSARMKQKFAEQLLENSVDQTISGKDLEYCLQALRILSPEEIQMHADYLRELLRTWFNQHYSSAQGSLADNLRRAICWIDEALYFGGVQ